MSETKLSRFEYGNFIILCDRHQVNLSKEQFKNLLVKHNIKTQDDFQNESFLSELLSFKEVSEIQQTLFQIASIEQTLIAESKMVEFDAWLNSDDERKDVKLLSKILTPLGYRALAGVLKFNGNQREKIAWYIKCREYFKAYPSDCSSPVDFSVIYDLNS